MLSQSRSNTEAAAGGAEAPTCSADGPVVIMEELSFNADHGYLEGLVRGMRAGILTQSDYHNLAQCDTLEGENRDVCLGFSRGWLLEVGESG